jgi:putative ABC transport system permease protein
MDTLGQDLRYAFRNLRMNPGFTAVAVAALGLGIGANTAIFSITSAVLLQPLPYRDAERLVMVWENDTREGNARNPLAPANLVDLSDQNRVFESLVFYDQPSGANLTGTDEPERVEAVSVSWNLLRALGVEVALGRDFTADDARPGAPPTAVLIGHGLWQRRFGADPAVVGRTLIFDGFPLSIAGVTPARFELPERAEILVAHALDGREALNRGQHYLRAVGRLKPGVGLREARADLELIARRLESAHPETNRGRGVTVLPVQEQFVGEVRPALRLLFGAVVFVLAIACANVANLLAARASSRRREIATRTALGASRFRIVRQLVTESLVLALAGGAVGLLLAAWGLDLLPGLGKAGIRHPEWIRIDASVLGFTLAVSVLSGILFGLAPALSASRLDPSEWLRGGRAGTGGGRGRSRSILVAVEIALALVLASGAGLLLKSFARLRGVDPGLESKNVLTAQLTLPYGRYSQPGQAAGFSRSLLDGVRAVSGVRAAAVISRLPLAGDRSTSGLAIEGRVAEPGKQAEVHYRVISPDYFTAVGIPLRAGRFFSEHDGADAAPAAIVNVEAARRYWPGESPVGKRIRLGPNANAPWITVVGVAGDARHFGLDRQAQPEAYVPYSQSPAQRFRIVIRTAGQPAAAVHSLRGVVRRLDRDLPVSQVRTLDELLDDSSSPRRLNAVLLGLFAALALVLAALGVYGVVSWSVQQRRREIGILIALGADRADVVRSVLRGAMVPATGGIAAGLGAAALLALAMRSLLYQVEPLDATVLGGAALLLAAAAAAASALPARRAALIDPILSLRQE